MRFAVILSVLLATSLRAIALMTPTATSANSESDALFAPASIWNNVGIAGDSTGEYLGNGWIITANHVAGTNATTINFQLTIGGITHVWTGVGSQLGNHDIFLAHLNPDSSGHLPEDYGVFGVTIATSSPAVGTPVSLIGYGYTATSPATYYTVSGSTWSSSTVNDPNSVAVYAWGQTPTLKKTWGTNTIWGTTANGSTLPGTSTPISQYTLNHDDALAIDFSSSRHGSLPASRDAATLFESGGALKDSGAGMFANVNGTMQLVGLLDTVRTWEGQPGNTTTVTNDTFAIDLTRYAAEINAVMVPEPNVVGLVFVGFTALTARLRPRSKRRL